MCTLHHTFTPVYITFCSRNTSLISSVLFHALFILKAGLYSGIDNNYSVDEFVSIKEVHVLASFRLVHVYAGSGNWYQGLRGYLSTESLNITCNYSL